MEANLNVPYGFRFLPTKKELFYFLWQKISSQQPSCGEYAIGELDLYNEEQLDEIFLKGEREDCPVYMFTRLKNKGKIGTKNKDRMVGKGTWKAQQNGKLEGFGGWRDFRYADSGCKRRHHQWNMTEFFLDEKQYPNVSLFFLFVSILFFFSLALCLLACMHACIYSWTRHARNNKLIYCKLALCSIVIRSRLNSGYARNWLDRPDQTGPAHFF